MNNQEYKEWVQAQRKKADEVKKLKAIEQRKRYEENKENIKKRERERYYANKVQKESILKNNTHFYSSLTKDREVLNWQIENNGTKGMGQGLIKYLNLLKPKLKGLSLSKWKDDPFSRTVTNYNDLENIIVSKVNIIKADKTYKVEAVFSDGTTFLWPGPELNNATSARRIATKLLGLHKISEDK